MRGREPAHLCRVVRQLGDQVRAALEVEGAAEARCQAVDQVADRLDGVRVARATPDAQQPLGQLGPTGHRGGDLLGVALHRQSGLGPADRAGVVVDHAEQVVDVVGHGRGQVAHRLGPTGPLELALHRRAFQRRLVAHQLPLVLDAALLGAVQIARVAHHCDQLLAVDRRESGLELVGTVGQVELVVDRMGVPAVDDPADGLHEGPGDPRGERLAQDLVDTTTDEVLRGPDQQGRIRAVEVQVRAVGADAEDQVRQRLEQRQHLSLAAFQLRPGGLHLGEVGEPDHRAHQVVTVVALRCGDQRADHLAVAVLEVDAEALTLLQLARPAEVPQRQRPRVRRHQVEHGAADQLVGPVAEHQRQPLVDEVDPVATRRARRSRRPPARRSGGTDARGPRARPRRVPARRGRGW